MEWSTSSAMLKKQVAGYWKKYNISNFVPPVFLTMLTRLEVKQDSAKQSHNVTCISSECLPYTFL